MGAKGSSSRRCRWVTLHTLTDRRSSGYPGQPPMSAGESPKVDSYRQGTPGTRPAHAGWNPDADLRRRLPAPISDH